MPELMIRPRTLRTRLALVGLGAIAAAGVMTMPAAHADGVADAYTAKHGAQVCADIAAYPTDRGVDQVALKMFADGLTPEQAATVLYSSMIVFCPQAEGPLRHWAGVGAGGSVAIA